MFGSSYFGQLIFAGVVAVTTPTPSTTPVCSPAFGGWYFGQAYYGGISSTSAGPTPVEHAKTGWPFGEDLSVPSPARIPYFAHLAALDREREADDEEVLHVLVTWLNHP